MAERLTEQKTRKGITKIVVKPFVDMYIVVHKLYLLEDIMEKYDFKSVEELDKKLADSNTWKNACELAFKNFRWNCNKCPREIWEKCDGECDYNKVIRYFYQQAKKDGG